MHLFDARSEQQLVFDLDGRLLRFSSAPPQVAEALVHEDESVLFSGTLKTPDRIGLLFHRLDPGGQIVSSFGEMEEAFIQRTIHDGRREIAASGGTRFWAAPPNRYSLTEWGPDGIRHRRLERSADWFPAHSGGLGFQPDSPPMPLLNDLQTDAQGRLWVLAAVADHDWQRALKPVVDPDHGGVTRHVPRDINDYLDTVVEVIDPESGELVVSSRFDALLHFAGPGLVYGVVEPREGEFRLRVWQVEIGGADPDPTEQPAVHGGSVRALSARELAMLRLGVRGHPEGTLEEILNRWPQQIVYVPERNALQARGCGGGVTIHVPLREGAGAMLEQLP